jgi:SAM-dependent methyltransferase
VLVDTARWHQPADAADLSAVSRVSGPTLDVGCGPGRIVAALLGTGVAALGIDVSAVAVDIARERGALAIQADVFGGVPAAGSWSTAMLLDGNIGIGGDPVTLLGRLGQLVEPRGSVIAEVERPGAQTHGRRARVCHDSGFSDWFDWARVSVVELRSCALAADWRVVDTWSVGDRWFGELHRRDRS